MFRHPTNEERVLLAHLASKTRGLTTDWVGRVRVAEMDDGEMGSLRLFDHESPPGERRFGREAAIHEYSDTDGVLVIASLYLDENGRPFELDMWKTDLSPVRDRSGGLK